MVAINFLTVPRLTAIIRVYNIFHQLSYAVTCEYIIIIMLIEFRTCKERFCMAKISECECIGYDSRKCHPTLTYNNIILSCALHIISVWLNINAYIFTVPAPTSVMLSSSIPNPIPPLGSSVTLTCAVELSPAVDIPVTVNTVLTTDEGLTDTRTAQPVMGSSTSYAATYVINTFGRSDSGLYICSATVSLTSANANIRDSNTVSHSVRVTTGEVFTVCAVLMMF